MPAIRRYAFSYVDNEGVEREWEVARENLTAEEAVAEFYENHSGAEIARTLRGDVPDSVDLSPPTNAEPVEESQPEDDEEVEEGSDEDDETDDEVSDE